MKLNEILIKPILSEKANALQEKNRIFSFRVARQANKLTAYKSSHQYLNEQQRCDGGSPHSHMTEALHERKCRTEPEEQKEVGWQQQNERKLLRRRK